VVMDLINPSICSQHAIWIMALVVTTHSVNRYGLCRWSLTIPVPRQSVRICCCLLIWSHGLSLVIAWFGWQLLIHGSAVLCCMSQVQLVKVCALVCFWISWTECKAALSSILVHQFAVCASWHVSRCHGTYESNIVCVKLILAAYVS
jgi:hypothetical protein